MPNLYLTAKGCGYAKIFFVRRERSADKKRWFYWLGHRTEDGMNSHRVRVSLEFYNDFRKEIGRLKEHWSAHKKLAADNFKKALALSKKKPHCGGDCKIKPICLCLCERCDINTPGKVRG